MGSGGQTTTQSATIPPELSPLVQSSAGWTMGLQNALPLSQFTGFSPADTADLSNLQKMGMNQIPNLFGTSPETMGQLGLINQLTAGPIGSSPTTTAGMDAWRANILPQVEDSASLMGLGRSGPALQDIVQSQTGTLLPLLQQEVQNRAAMVPQMGGIAQRQFDEQAQGIQVALQAGQISRDVAQQQMDAARQEFLRLSQLSEQATLGPIMTLAPSLIGSNTHQRSALGIVGNVLGK